MSRQTGGAIIFNKNLNRILLVRNKTHKKWGMPKGGVKNNETTCECAYREVFEETGIDLNKKGKIFGTIDIKNQHYLLVHMDEYIEYNIRDTEEIDKIGFFPLTYLKNLNSNIGLKLFTENYVKKNLKILSLRNLEYSKQIYNQG
jgi:mRNA-decapping enzyme subunit 2